MSYRLQIPSNCALGSLIVAVGFILLGPQNRLYCANSNWIYCGYGNFEAITILAALLLAFWALLANKINSIKSSRLLADPHLYIDSFVLVMALSCVANKYTVASSIYLIALLIGIIICKWILYLKLNSHQVATLLYCIVGCAAIVAVTNLVRLYFGWTLPFTLPPGWFRYESSERLSLWFGNPNDLGCVMAVAAVLATWLMERVQGRILRTVTIVLFCIFFKVLLETYSRGAMVGFVVGLIVYLVNPRSKTKATAPLLCILAVTLCSFGSFDRYSDRLQSTADIRAERSINSRLIVWRESLDIVKHHPVFGVGLGNFGFEFASQYHGSSRLPGYSTAMNNLLTLSAESGLIAILPYLALIGYAVKMGLYGIVAQRHQNGDIGAVLASALCIMVTCGLFTYSLCKVYYCISWIIIALILCGRGSK